MSIITENPGVLYITSQGLDKSQIEDVISRVFDRASRILNRKVDRTHELNMVIVKGNHLYSYVFIKDRGVVNVMQNLNEDGTPRVEKRIKKDCKYNKRNRLENEREKSKRLKQLYNQYFGHYYDEDNKNWKKDAARVNNFSWADFQEEEDNIVNDYEPQYEKIKLPDVWTDYHDTHYKKVETFPSKPKNVEEGKKSNVLEGMNVINNNPIDIPSWVTEEMLINVFKPYDSKNNYRLIVKDKDIARQYYPVVTFHTAFSCGKNVRACRIEFDPQGNDARYAIHMKRKVELSNGRERVTLMFDFSKH